MSISPIPKHTATPDIPPPANDAPSATKAHYKLGEIFCAKGWLDAETLQHTLTLQQQQKQPLGKLLTATNTISPLQLRDALAIQHRLPVVDLLKMPPDISVCNADHRQAYFTRGLIPWRMRKGRLVMALSNPCPEHMQWAKQHYGTDITFAITSPRDIQHALTELFSHEDSTEAQMLLHREQPRYSALRQHSKMQQLFTLCGLGGIVLTLAFFPQSALLAFALVLSVFYALTLIFKAVLFSVGQHSKHYHTTVRQLPDKHLPIYTVLVPLYKEQRSLKQMMHALNALDYPKAKLDVKLIVEADDTETVEALKALQPPHFCEIIHVPVSFPRTKPKACNYAVRFARGELVTIFDAEDVPDPQQLRKAASFFLLSDDQNTHCVQARLNYYNRDTNLLTKLFSIEYGCWFNYMLKGLSRLGIPLPLGGTSNHMPLQTLRHVHAWDPHNVTEDADLGMRIALYGGGTALLDSTTEEEAPHRLYNWLRQRSRWIKGYMQTYLVYMRHPIQLFQQLGPVGFLGFQLFIGGPIAVFLLSPFLWLLAPLWAFGIVEIAHSPAIDTLENLIVFNLCFGIAIHVWHALIVCRDEGWNAMGLAIITYPLYWLLHSVASFRALWQLVFNPYYWEKTTHGFCLQKSEEEDPNDLVRALAGAS